jgi:hypothetical protein
VLTDVHWLNTPAIYNQPVNVKEIFILSSFDHAAYNICRRMRDEQKQELLDRVIRYVRRKKAPLPSLTGFQMSSRTPTRTSPDLLCLTSTIIPCSFYSSGQLPWFWSQFSPGPASQSSFSISRGWTICHRRSHDRSLSLESALHIHSVLWPVLQNIFSWCVKCLDMSTRDAGPETWSDHLKLLLPAVVSIDGPGLNYLGKLLSIIEL